MKIKKGSLPEAIAEGGEGFIYEINGEIIKIYKDHVNKREKEEKIMLLMGKTLPKEVIQPIGKIMDEKDHFIGYKMKKVQGEELKKLSNKKYVRTNGIKIDQILEMMVKIKNTIKSLHKQGIVIGDFNENNILFDKKGDIYFIDCDSWKVGNLSCDVCMESFKDPQLKGNQFTKETDYYAYAILLFKSLTRMHAFGGVTTPEMNLTERMEKKISVIGRKEIKVPKNITNYTIFSPDIISKMKEIFESDKRFLLDKEVEEMKNLKECKKHGDFYYSKYNGCPLCEKNAVLIEKPTKMEDGNKIPYALFAKLDEVLYILNDQSYLNSFGQIVHLNTGKKVNWENNEKIYFSENGDIVYKTNKEKIEISRKTNEYLFEKKYKTKIKVKDNKCFYITKSNMLTEIEVDERGNRFTSLAKVANNHEYLAIDRKNYLIINRYDNMVVINDSGYHQKIEIGKRIEGITIHFDEAKGNWLVILELVNGEFNTYVIHKGKILYETNMFRYLNGPENIAFSNGIIFKPDRNHIKAFDYQQNRYKKFELKIANEDSKLIRLGKNFLILNEKEIYIAG